MTASRCTPTRNVRSSSLCSINPMAPALQPKAHVAVPPECADTVAAVVETTAEFEVALANPGQAR
jgi:hypothetical protein